MRGRILTELVALTTDEVWRLAGIPATTLNYWVSKGLCGPSLRESMGKRYVRYWSVRDMVTVRAVKALREAGCPLQRVRLVQERLEEQWNENIASAVLFWDGQDVLKVEDQGEIVSVLRDSGQQLTVEVVHVMTFPLRMWIQDALSVAHEVDLEELADARIRRETRRRQDEVAPAVLQFQDAFRAETSAG